MADVSQGMLARLLKLRVVVAGAGAFAIRRTDAGAMGTCVLPSSGAFVKFGSHGACGFVPGASDRLGPEFEGAQMFYPTGNPVSGPLPLEIPAFASLMHNVDLEMLGDFSGAACPLPPEMRDLVDFSVASRIFGVEEAVEAAYAQGRTVEFPDLGNNWSLGSDGGYLVDAAMNSGDADLERAAQAVWSASMAGGASRKPGSRIDKSRWEDLASSWEGPASASPRR